MVGSRTAAGLCALVISAVVGPSAWAQDAEDEGPKVQSIQMIERGLFVEAEGGVTGFVATLTDDGDDRSYGAATTLSAFLGYDVLPILSIGIGVRALAAGVSAPDVGGVTQGADVFHLAPMATVRLGLLTTQRNFVWARADAGFAFGFTGNAGGADEARHGVIASVLVGYERFTKLRHFSFGASVGATVVTEPLVAIGITVMPHVKYTF